VGEEGPVFHKKGIDTVELDKSPTQKRNGMDTILAWGGDGKNSTRFSGRRSGRKNIHLTAA